MPPLLDIDVIKQFTEIVSMKYLWVKLLEYWINVLTDNQLLPKNQWDRTTSWQNVKHV